MVIRIALLLALALTLAACQDDDIAITSSKGALSDIHWVGTSTVYGNAAGKHDHTIVFVVADWCSWSRKLTSETLCNSAVQAELNGHFNAVLLETTADTLVNFCDTMITCRSLASRYGITGYPTSVALDRNGKFITRFLGYRDASSMLIWLKAIRGAL